MAASDEHTHQPGATTLYMTTSQSVSVKYRLRQRAPSRQVKEKHAPLDEDRLIDEGDDLSDDDNHAIYLTEQDKDEDWEVQQCSTPLPKKRSNIHLRLADEESPFKRRRLTKFDKCESVHYWAGLSLEYLHKLTPPQWQANPRFHVGLWQQVFFFLL